MKHDFHIGDFIVIENSSHFPSGTTAEILDMSPSGLDLKVRVDLDKPDRACHSCGGKCEIGYGWTIPARRVRLMEIKTGDPDIADTDLMQILGGSYGL